MKVRANNGNKNLSKDGKTNLFVRIKPEAKELIDYICFFEKKSQGEVIEELLKMRETKEIKEAYEKGKKAVTN